MNENKPSSMLQRLPVILAVTAASYGLQLPVNAKPVATPKSQSKSTQVTTPVRSGNVRG